MSEMRGRRRIHNGNPVHAQRAVETQYYEVGRNRLGKTRPACTRMKLVLGVEERLPCRCGIKYSRALRVNPLTGPGVFGSLFAQNIELQGTKTLVPLAVAQHD